MIDRTGHSTTEIHFKIRSYVSEACLVKLNLLYTKLPEAVSYPDKTGRKFKEKITYTTLAELSLRSNFQKAFFQTNCNILGKRVKETSFQYHW